MRIVLVKVGVRDGCIDQEDAVGVWKVELTDDLDPGQAVGAALDVFHSHVAIAELDDYLIETYDPDTHEEICEADDYQTYSKPEGGQIERINGVIDDAPSP
jgi:hypothetical protein